MSKFQHQRLIWNWLLQPGSLTKSPISLTSFLNFTHVFNICLDVYFSSIITPKYFKILTLFIIDYYIWLRDFIFHFPPIIMNLVMSVKLCSLLLSHHFSETLLHFSSVYFILYPLRTIAISSAYTISATVCLISYSYFKQVSKTIFRKIGSYTDHRWISLC